MYDTNINISYNYDTNFYQAIKKSFIFATKTAQFLLNL